MSHQKKKRGSGARERARVAHHRSDMDNARKVVGIIQERWQAAFDVIVEREAKKRTIFCERGCTACCFYQVTVCMTEALAMLGAYYELPKATRDVVRRQMDARVKLLREQDLWAGYLVMSEENLDKAADIEDMATEVATVALREKVPCMFLVDGDCAIYENRPVVCRAHFSLVPRAACATEHDIVVPQLDVGFARNAMYEDFVRAGILFTISGELHAIMQELLDGDWRNMNLNEIGVISGLVRMRQSIEE